MMRFKLIIYNDMYLFTIVVVSVLYEEQIIPIKHESIFCKLS